MPPKRKATKAAVADTDSTVNNSADANIPPTKKPASTRSRKPVSTTSTRVTRSSKKAADEISDEPLAKKAKLDPDSGLNDSAKSSPVVPAPLPSSAVANDADVMSVDDSSDTKASKPRSTRKPSSTRKPTSTASKSRAPRSKAQGSKKDSDENAASSTPVLLDSVAEEELDNKDGIPEPAKQEPPQKMVTVIKRGAAPVDPTSSYVQTHQVYDDGRQVWDAMLNQTDLGKNANKFYVLQLLYPIGNDSSCILFLRWGRVGENGQSQSKGPFPATTAIMEFKKQFRAKTGTPWESRQGMVAPKGKYTWLERSFEDEETDSKDSNGEKAKEKADEEQIPDPTLPTEVQELCRIIFSTELISNALSSMNYDANKLPLGKLAKSTILNGFAALKALAEVIESQTVLNNGLQAACEELSNRYYSIIPHVFGRNRPTVIGNTQLLKKARELELVDALGDMEIAQKLISASSNRDKEGRLVNPMDSKFQSLGLEWMLPVQRGCKEFTSLQTYARDSHGSTHNFKIEIQNAFRVQRCGEAERWAARGFDKLQDGERLLLWHGSRATNFAGILSQGLRIAPPEAPVSGYMFGKGVYFADMISKSANYCHSYSSNNVGILLLCEVAAKPCLEFSDADYNADNACKTANKLTTKGCGKTRPIDWQDAGEALDNDALKGVHMPKGAAETDSSLPGWLQYNEYIAYDVAQIRTRYLLMVKIG